MVEGVNIRLALYAAVALLVAYLIYREHSLTRKLSQVRAELIVSEASLETERKARQHEIQIAKKASDEYQAELDRIRSTPDLGPVRLCKRASVPTATESGAATGSDEGSARHVEEPDEVDIGPQLNDFVEDCEANAAQLSSLQDWVMAR